MFWQNLVLRRELAPIKGLGKCCACTKPSWGWLRDDGLERRPAQHIIMTLPPFAVTSVSADSLWATALRHPRLDATNRFGDKLLELADMKFDLGAQDGASGNLRMEAHELNVLPKDLIKSKFWCRNHVQQLVHGDVSAGAFGLDFISKLMTCSLFFRMGCNWVRMSSSRGLRSYFESGGLIRVMTQPTAADVMMAQELADYFVANRHYESHAAHAGRRGKKPGCKRRFAMLCAVFSPLDLSWGS